MKARPDDAVKVAVRCRPMNSKEKKSGFFDVVHVDESRGEIHVQNPSNPNVS
jgi:hypothetical protein